MQGPVTVEIYNGEFRRPTRRVRHAAARGRVPQPARCRSPCGIPRRGRGCSTARCCASRHADSGLRRRRRRRAAERHRVRRTGRPVRPHGGCQPGGNAASVSNAEPTVLEQVRAMPDQSLPQAMAVNYLPVQNRCPTMLSLAGRQSQGHGPAIRRGRFRSDLPGFRAAAQHAPPRPDFRQRRNSIAFSDTGMGEHPGYSRRLDGGWLPMPHIRVEENGIVYHQTVFVAPWDKPGVQRAVALPASHTAVRRRVRHRKPRPGALAGHGHAERRGGCREQAASHAARLSGKHCLVQDGDKVAGRRGEAARTAYLRGRGRPIADLGRVPAARRP